MYSWVPDGVYDYQAHMVRYTIYNGRPQIVISRMWLDSGGPDDVAVELRLPWGSYPDLPPKPPKN